MYLHGTTLQNHGFPFEVNSRSEFCFTAKQVPLKTLLRKSCIVFLIIAFFLCIGHLRTQLRKYYGKDFPYTYSPLAYYLFLLSYSFILILSQSKETATEERSMSPIRYGEKGEF